MTHYTQLLSQVQVLKDFLYTKSQETNNFCKTHTYNNPADSSHLPVDVVRAFDAIESEINKAYKIECEILDTPSSVQHG